MKSQRATERWRSSSGAAVRRTRGGEQGCALGCARSSGGKSGYGFPAALGRAWGCGLGRIVGRVIAALRTAGLARRAFGPPPERAARTRQNWGGEWVLCFCGSQSRAGRSLPQRRLATGVALGPAGFDPLRQLHFLRLGCVSLRYRWRQTAGGQERLARFSDPDRIGGEF